jgi:hypothetical protein
MAKRMFVLFAASAALLASWAASAQYDGDRYRAEGDRRGDGQIVRCDSQDKRTRECPVDTRGGVRLARNLSDTPCQEGRNWGYHRDSIWVSGGCRGEFEVGGRGNGRPGGWNGNGNGNGYGRGRTVSCGSVNRQTQECFVDTRGGVRLTRKLSDTRCTEGQTWGYHPDRIWVSGGCRAEFEVGRGGGNQGGGWNGGGGESRIVSCGSVNRQTQECFVDTRGGVRLTRKLSDTHCTEGQTWGYRSDRIWVSGGCRAEFEVSGRYRR